jgi:ABC-2 type transport system ATP-binding protein
VLTTHYMEEAERLSDRIAIMDKGKVIARGTPAELIGSIGVDHLLEFSIADDGDPLDLDAIRRIEGVRELNVDDGVVRLQTLELHRVVPALLDELTRQVVHLTELRTRSATLEDVFVSLTGRHLRDD